MSKVHKAIVLADGTIRCICGSGVQHWYPNYDWETALVCRRSSTPIANRETAKALYAEATQLIGTL